MAAYRRVYDSRHLQADCQEPGSAPEPYARQSIFRLVGYLHFIVSLFCFKFFRFFDNFKFCPRSVLRWLPTGFWAKVRYRFRFGPSADHARVIKDFIVLHCSPTLRYPEFCCDLWIGFLIREAATQGRTDHFPTGVVYSQFPIGVYFCSTLRELVFLSNLTFTFSQKGTFSYCILELLHVTITLWTGPRDRSQDQSRFYVSRSSIILFESVRAQTKAYIRTHLTQYTKWSVIN